MPSLDGSSRGVFRAGLGELSRALDPARSVVVSDAELRRLYGGSFPPCPVLEVPRGEAAKGLRELEGLYEGFARLGLDRDATVVAIGGGSISDLAGFAAATWLRGIDFCAAPTTLLAMVDASLGGKNGVDFGGYKNLVGTFHPPRLVLCDLSVLASLGDEEFASGMAEAIKHAVIEGGEHFAFVERECGSRAALDPGRLERLVAYSQAVKLGIAGRDPKESGERRLLNLGHTIGHAIEAVTGLPHGHSVAAGMASAFRLAGLRAGRRDARDLERVSSLLEAWGLPASIEAARLAALGLPHNARSAPADRGAALGDGRAFRRAVAAALSSDKKRSGGEIRFALPRAIGSVSVEPIPLAEIERFVIEAP